MIWAVVLTGMCLLSNLLFHDRLIRLAIILIFALVAILKRRDILALLKTIRGK
ncbi:MAG: hypothetical protein IJ751_08895 [Oscillospiraceae bacterium]|nr:hypothetical protein [Oscillospiraceae bacterium]